MKGGGSMKNFEVIKLNDSEYDYMVMATTADIYIRMFNDCLSAMERDFAKRKEDMEVEKERKNGPVEGFIEGLDSTI